jgi:hypothetical protein
MDAPTDFDFIRNFPLSESFQELYRYCERLSDLKNVCLEKASFPASSAYPAIALVHSFRPGQMRIPDPVVSSAIRTELHFWGHFRIAGKPPGTSL